jgi:putative holliday junction resolvase
VRNDIWLIPQKSVTLAIIQEVQIKAEFYLLFSCRNKTANSMKSSGRILALDLGAKRIGVAVSDELQIAARGVCVLTRETPEKLLAAVQKLIEEFDAAAVVIGLPLNFDGSESAGATEARKSAAFFTENLTVPVYLQDERLTSREAEENLREQGYSQKEIKKLVDQEAAAVILRDFMAQNS